MQKDLVSVIVPVFNREDYICDTIDSILEQTYENLEIIAVNDGSTDSSLSILREYEKKYSDKITVIDQENQGQVKSRNNAIVKSNGEFIAFLDSDDLWLPEKLEKQIPLFVGDIGLVYCAVHIIDENNHIISTDFCEEEVKGDIYPHLLIKNRMTGGTVVIRREAIDRVGLFDTNFPAAENWDLWIRISKCFPANFINQPLVKYRRHPGNMSKDSLLMLNVIESILNKHCSDKPSSPEIGVAFTMARANHAYRKGIYHFSKFDYADARVNFKQTLSLAPGYKDTRIRLLRTYLGKTGNRFLSFVKLLSQRIT